MLVNKCNPATATKVTRKDDASAKPLPVTTPCTHLKDQRAVRLPEASDTDQYTPSRKRLRPNDTLPPHLRQKGNLPSPPPLPAPPYPSYPPHPSPSSQPIMAEEVEEWVTPSGHIRVAEPARKRFTFISTPEGDEFHQERLFRSSGAIPEATPQALAPPVESLKDTPAPAANKKSAPAKLQLPAGRTEFTDTDSLIEALNAMIKQNTFHFEILARNVGNSNGVHIINIDSVSNSVVLSVPSIKSAPKEVENKEPKPPTPTVEHMSLAEFMVMTETHKDHKASRNKGAVRDQADLAKAPQAAPSHSYSPPRDSLEISNEADDLDDMLEKEWLKRLAIPFEGNIESDQEEPHLKEESESAESVDIFGNARPVSQMIFETETEEEPQAAPSADCGDTSAADRDPSSVDVCVNYESGTSTGDFQASAFEADDRDGSGDEAPMDSHETSAKESDQDGDSSQVSIKKAMGDRQDRALIQGRALVKPSRPAGPFLENWPVPEPRQGRSSGEDTGSRHVLARGTNFGHWQRGAYPRGGGNRGGFRGSFRGGNRGAYRGRGGHNFVAYHNANQAAVPGGMHQEVQQSFYVRPQGPLTDCVADFGVIVRGFPLTASKLAILRELHGGSVHSISMYRTGEGERVAAVFFKDSESADRICSIHKRKPLSVLGCQLRLTRKLTDNLIPPKMDPFHPEETRVLRLENLPEHRFRPADISRWLFGILGGVNRADVEFNHSDGVALAKFTSIKEARCAMREIIDVKGVTPDYRGVSIEYDQDPCCLYIEARPNKP